MPIAVPVSPKGRSALLNPLFIASLLCMLLAEAFVIHGLWFRRHPSPHALHGTDLPFLVWIPALAACILLQSLGRLGRKGQISPSLATSLSSGIALVLLLAYLLMTRFAEIAFR